MPTPTYTPLANITLGSTATTVSFSSINQGFRDLIVIFTGTTPFNNTAYVNFNGDTSSNYSSVVMRGGNGGVQSASSSAASKLDITGDTLDSSTVSNFIFHIMDYSATDKHKTTLSRANNSDVSLTTASAGRWASTSAVSSMTFIFGNGSSGFNSGCSFALYGIAST